MLCVGLGAGWLTLPRLWWHTTSWTWGFWRRWWALASSCCSWCSGRCVNTMTWGGTAWPSSVSGVSAACSAPPGFLRSFLLKPQKPSSSSSASLTPYKVSFRAVSLFLCPSQRAARQRQLLMWHKFPVEIKSERNVPAVCLLYTLLLFNSSRFSLEFRE